MCAGAVQRPLSAGYDARQGEQSADIVLTTSPEFWFKDAVLSNENQAGVFILETPALSGSLSSTSCTTMEKATLSLDKILHCQSLAGG